METVVHRLSAAERLQADYPDAGIWREQHADGTHGDWIAEVRVRLRADTLETLRVLLNQLVRLRGSDGKDAAGP